LSWPPFTAARRDAEIVEHEIDIAGGEIGQRRAAERDTGTCWN